MGGRFCSLDQTHSKCESGLVEIMSFRPRNRVKAKKKGSSPKIEFLSPKSSEDQKIKKKGLHRNLRLNSAGICGIYSCWKALFRLIKQHSNLDGGPLSLDGGTLNLDGGTLTLDGETRPPYNLSTAFNAEHQSGKQRIPIFMSLVWPDR